MPAPKYIQEKKAKKAKPKVENCYLEPPMKVHDADFSDIAAEPSLSDVYVCADDSSDSSFSDPYVPRISITSEEPSPDRVREPEGGVKPAVFTLTEQQEEAKERILEWVNGPEKIYRLGGFAGTGKTSLLKYLLPEFSKRGYATLPTAFTGKACSVLRKKGMPYACTLHYLMYDPQTQKNGKTVWVRKPDIPPDLVIVDEASMISHDLYDDLMSFPIKILFVGDPAQLEPVGTNPNLMREADFVLTQVHRQARNSPILNLATEIREGRMDLPIGEWKGGDSKLRIMPKGSKVNLEEFDTIICGTNKTRHIINAKRRMQLGFFGEPQEGETVICLRNDRTHKVFNGLVMTLDTIRETKTMKGHETIIADLLDYGDIYPEVPIRSDTFCRETKNLYTDASPPIPFDYGYCLTAWKAQGSEWDRVLWYDETMPKVDWTRLAYTALTRASQEITVVKL